ncbi:recombinase family protein [Streptomyces sp. NPDC018584]|uniref:recombinase family protein n=1 Tax=unclassified Streptomyces TaxID=2593676 RepID=UPI00379BB33E
MGQQIIRQPDGKYSVFSSVTNTFIVLDASEEELIEWRATEAADRARDQAGRELERVKSSDSRPYHQFTLTWEEAVRLHKKYKGTDDSSTRLTSSATTHPPLTVKARGDMSDKALIYTRYATGAGLEVQEAACREFAEQKGFEVLDVRNVAGSTDVVDRALSDINGGAEFDILISEELTIFSRNNPRLLSLVQQAAERGIRVFTADGTELTSAANSWQISMMTAINALEEARSAEEREAMRSRGYTQVTVELSDGEVDALEDKLKNDPATENIWLKIKDSIDAFRSETDAAANKCADCGKRLPEGSKRTECRHCEKCVDFACMSTHGRNKDSTSN